ncbi:polypeptide deformylase [Legionella busanensis]|uniref:Peptide deformylase n=1 Tax=Legionella busanensis TaxID=190655 RepID=A0A378JP90_9GAMM|nr:peptide deformylase [Legionella busanensis]STX52498.1 polypeptide deformylase [Legionella busanensis]
MLNKKVLKRLSYLFVIFLHSCKISSPQPLNFVSSTSPILHKVIKPVTFPLTNSDKALIKVMKYSILPAQLQKRKAAWSDSVGMAANQWGIDKRIFLFSPKGSDKEIEVIINPDYIPVPTTNNKAIKTEYEWEGCFSLPFKVGYVKRYLAIKAIYQNEQGKIITKYLSGYPARVWQHETDHLNGKLYNDNSLNIYLEEKVFSTKELAEAFYNAMEEEKGRY